MPDSSHEASGKPGAVQEFRYFGELTRLSSSEFRVERGTSPLSSSQLENVDVVVIATPRTNFADEEVDTLRGFVERGGGLLVVQDAGPDVSGGANQLAEAFGIQYRVGALCSAHPDWDAGSFQVRATESASLVVQGIDQFQMNWGTSIVTSSEDTILLQTDEFAWQDTNGNRRTDQGEPQGPLVVAIARYVDRGRITFIADNAFHDNIWYANGDLLLSVLGWLSESEQGNVVWDVPGFDVDPDVTLDSVVQIADGPQEVSADIKFYPNTRRARPGDTVYWTLDLGDLEGPFAIVPELNNDKWREQTIRTAEKSVSIDQIYSTPGIYVPRLEVTDGEGNTRTVFSTTVLSVLPDLEERRRIGIDVPTPSDPTGDVLKGIQVLCLDERRFASADGEAGIRDELASWRAAGINFVMYNIALFVDGVYANVSYPHYGEGAPVPWATTWDFEAITKLTDWAHDLGIRVALRPFMMVREDSSGASRFDCSPTDLDLYFHYHVQIKKALAQLAELLGVDMFNIDAENLVTSLNIEALEVVQAVRGVFTGIVSDTVVVDQGALYLSPLHSYFDLVYVSLGPYFQDLPDAATSELAGAFHTQISQEVLPALQRLGKPGIVEAFVSLWPSGYGYRNEYEEFQKRGYEAMLGFLNEPQTLLMGLTFWETVLDDRRYYSQFDPFGRPAQEVLTRYCRDFIPDSREYSFEPLAAPPRVLQVLDAFDTAVSRGSFIIAEGLGSVDVSTSRFDKYEGSGATIANFTTAAATGYRYYFLITQLPHPEDWRSFGSITIWVKTDGTRGKLRLELWDEDGDRFTSLLNAPPAEWEWVPITVRLSDFTQPDWSQQGDGHLDLSRVSRWAFGQSCDENVPSLRTLIDFAYLGE